MSKRVKWSYRHSLNSTSSTRITKTGTYYGKVKHTYKHWLKPGARQMAVVQFDGNKWSSHVPFNELREVRDGD